MAVAAQGLAKAAQILAGGFTLVATNVPYLGRGKQDKVLKGLLRAGITRRRRLILLRVSSSAAWTSALARWEHRRSSRRMNWLYLDTYKKLSEAAFLQQSAVVLW
jgi:hypothetical protein